MHPDSFGKNLSTELAIIVKKVSSGSYHFTPFKEKLISKGAESLPRVISIPTVRDRIVLRSLCDLLASVFPEAVSDIPQVKIDILGKAIASNNYQEYVKIDLQKFYPSIAHDKLLKALKVRIRKPEILALLKEAITTPTVPAQKGGKGAKKNTKGVPQGLAISNILAEILLRKLDADMASIPSICYQRYVDDILILCPTGRALQIAEDVITRLEALDLKSHILNGLNSKTKSGPLTGEFDFLGYGISSGDLSIRKSSTHNFESAIAKILTSYRHKLVKAKTPADKQRALDICKWRLNLRITGCIFGGKRMGWVFYFSQITSTSRLRAVDDSISSLLKRFSLDGEISVKRLLKTYYECKRKDKSGHHYIPNFDTMIVDERRKILMMLLGNRKISGLTDKRINQLFEMKISAAVKELEQDLAGIS